MAAMAPWGFGVSRVTYLIGKDGRIREAAKAALRVGPHLALAEKALVRHPGQPLYGTFLAAPTVRIFQDAVERTWSGHNGI